MNKKRKYEGARERKTGQFKALRKTWRILKGNVDLTKQPQCSSSFLNVNLAITPIWKNKTLRLVPISMSLNVFLAAIMKWLSF